MQEVIRKTVDNSLACIALYLLDKKGQSREFVIDCLDGIGELCASVNQNRLSLDDVRETLKEEYHLEIKKIPKE